MSVGTSIGPLPAVVRQGKLKKASQDVAKGQADLDSRHVNGAIGNCDKVWEQVLAGWLVQGEVPLVLTHHHH